VCVCCIHLECVCCIHRECVCVCVCVLYTPWMLAMVFALWTILPICSYLSVRMQKYLNDLYFSSYLICMYIFMYIYVYIYIYIHTYTNKTCMQGTKQHSTRPKTNEHIQTVRNTRCCVESKPRTVHFVSSYVSKACVRKSRTHETLSHSVSHHHTYCHSVSHHHTSNTWKSRTHVVYAVRVPVSSTPARSGGGFAGSSMLSLSCVCECECVCVCVCVCVVCGVCVCVCKYISDRRCCPTPAATIR